jgi:uncharacterized protein with FMN-binding domain
VKKFLLSISVIIFFGIFAIYQRKTTPQVGLIAPKNIPSINSTSSVQSQLSKNSTKTTVATNTPSATGIYRDGTYTGSSADAYYGSVQVKATINGGKITDVQFLDYPHDRSTSASINSQAMPYLKQEAIQAQTANVDIISGATMTSGAFIQSLQSALNQA